ncbi:unnamed protein product, partial [Meganyctiphanes norvegica]
MECGQCGEWIHAHCEGLNNEHYQILSFLPDSVEYVCQGCQNTSKASWLEAVASELLAGCQSVIQSMMATRAAKHLIKKELSKITQINTNTSLIYYKKESRTNCQAENKDDNTHLVDNINTSKEIKETNVQEEHNIYQSNSDINLKNKEESKITSIKENTASLINIVDQKSSDGVLDIFEDQSDKKFKNAENSIVRHVQNSSLNEVSNVAGVMSKSEQKSYMSDNFILNESQLSVIQEASYHVSNSQVTEIEPSNQLSDNISINPREIIVQDIQQNPEKHQEIQEFGQIRKEYQSQRMEIELGKKKSSFPIMETNSLIDITKSKDQEVEENIVKQQENKDSSVENISIHAIEKNILTEQHVKESLTLQTMQKCDEIAANLGGIDDFDQQNTDTKTENAPASNPQGVTPNQYQKTSMTSVCSEDKNKDKRKSSKFYPLRKTRSSVSIRRSLPSGIKLRECSVRLNDIYKIPQKNSTTNEMDNEDKIAHISENETLNISNYKVTELEKPDKVTQLENPVENSDKSSFTSTSQNTSNCPILSGSDNHENNVDSKREDRTTDKNNDSDDKNNVDSKNFSKRLTRSSLDVPCEILKTRKSSLEFCSDVSCTQVDGPNDESSSHMVDFFRSNSIQQGASVMLDNLQNKNNQPGKEIISPKNKISKDIDDDCLSSEESSFCDTDTEIESIQDDPDEPKDFFTVQEKICEKKYNSVLQFHVDMTRIIENGKHFNHTQSKNVQANYTKNMKEYFPWFDVQNANIFELVDKNRPFPIPHGDHDYAFQIGNNKKSYKLHDASSSQKRKLSPYKQVFLCSKDNRRCFLCGRESDLDPNSSGRLLYLGQNEWLHVNCGLWSSEVYEEADGGMQNVYLAVSRGRMIKCIFCQERGATVGCCHKSCPVTYHFPCARKAHCQFMEDRRIFCPTHHNSENGKSKKDDFKVSRCVYVDMDSEKKKWKQALGNKVNIVIGSLSITNLGRIVSVSDNNEALIPLGFMCTRLYWSTVDPTQRVRYTCTSKLIVPEHDGILSCNTFHSTIDHSLSPQLVSKQMATVQKWFKQLEHHNVEETSRKTNIIPPHLCPLYRSILDQEAAIRRDEILSDRESPPIIVESVVRQCIDEIIEKVSRSVEEESLLLDTDLPAIVSADDNELISMVLNDLDACDPTMTLQSTPSTSGRPSPLDIDFLNTCEQMLENAKSPENGNKGSTSDDGSKQMINSAVDTQSTISTVLSTEQCPIEDENIRIIQKLPTSDISTPFNIPMSCPLQVYPEMDLQMVPSKHFQQDISTAAVYHLHSQLPSISQIEQPIISSTMPMNPVIETPQVVENPVIEKMPIPEFSITDPQKNTTTLTTFIPTSAHANTSSSTTFSGLSTFIPPSLNSGNENAFSTCFTTTALTTNLSNTPSFICSSFNNEARSNNTTFSSGASSTSPSSSNSSSSPSSSNSSSSNSCSGSSSSGESSSPERSNATDMLSKKQILDTPIVTESVERESNVKEISGETTNAGEGSTSDSKCTGSGSVSSDCSSSGSESSLSTVRVSGKQNQSSTKLIVGKGSNSSSHKQVCRVLPMPASNSRRSSSASDHSDHGHPNISSSTTQSSSTSSSSSNESPNQQVGQHSDHPVRQHSDHGLLSPSEQAAAAGNHSSSDPALESAGYKSPSSPSDCTQNSSHSDRDSHHSATSPDGPHRTSGELTEDRSTITQDKKCKKICMKRNYKTVIKKYPLRSGMKKNEPYETVQIEINETIEIPGSRGSRFVRKSMKRKWSGILNSEEEIMQNKSEDSKTKKGDSTNSIQCDLEEDNQTSKMSKKVLKFTDDNNDITVSILNNNNLCEFGKSSRVRKYRHRTVLQLDGAADGSSSSAEMSQDEGVTDGSSDLSHDEISTKHQPKQSMNQQSTANKEGPSDYCSLAMRIKQQSLARSAPGEEGPYKCAKCKRLYRTKESYQKHVETCTFEIDSSSTSDEEEESENMSMNNQNALETMKNRLHNQVCESKINSDKDVETNENKEFEGLGLGTEVEKELMQQKCYVASDEKANSSSHIGSLEHLSKIVDSVQEIDSSSDEPLTKKQRLNPSFPRQSGVHRQLRTGIFKRSGNISSLDETDEEAFPNPSSSDTPVSDVFIPPAVSPIKFNPIVKKSSSPRRYTNVRLMRGAHGYQYRRLTTNSLSQNQEQFSPSQIHGNSSPQGSLQDSTQPLPSNFGQSMESETIASYQSGESSQYCGSNTQVSAVPQIVTVMSAPSVAVPPGYALQYVGSYRDGSDVTASNPGGNSGVLNVANPSVTPSPNVNSSVLSYGSTPVGVQPPQMVDSDVVNHSGSGGIINYPSGSVVMPQPQIIMASQQGSLMLPQVVNTNITYTFASPETLLLNQPTVIGPGMQQFQYVSQSQQQQGNLLPPNPEVVQFNPGATAQTQQNVQISPGLMQAPSSTGHIQPSATHHPTIVPHHLSNVHMQSSSTVVASHQSSIIANQMLSDHMQQSDGMTSHLPRIVTQNLSSGQIPTSYVTISDIPSNQSCLPQQSHITHQNIHHRSSMTLGTLQNEGIVFSANLPVVSDSVNINSTDSFSNSVTLPNRSRPQASVAPHIIQPQESHWVTEKPLYETAPVRLPFSERPGGSVTRSVATVAPVTAVNITTSTSVASSRMETSTTHTENSVPRVATVRPRPTYSYRDAMQDKNVSRDRIDVNIIKPLEHISDSQLPKTAKSDSETDSEVENNNTITDNDGKENEEKTQSYKLVMRKDGRTRTGFNVLPVSGPSIPITSPEVKELRIKAKVSVGPKRKKAKNLDSDDLLILNKDPNCDVLLNEEFPNVSENAEHKQLHLPQKEQTSLFDTSGHPSSEPYIVFELTSDDGFHVESRHISEVWQKVFDAVGAARASMRANDKVSRGFHPSVGSPISGLHMLGLTHNAVQYLLEQLPGSKDCHKYSFQFHRRPQEEGEVEENLTGCARTEPFKCRSPYDIFSWLASKHRRLPERSVTQQEEIQLSTRRATSLELPMAMRYRHLRETAREAVGVFRSEIHGRGLFCKRDIDSGEMVIEYAGQVIRSSLCDNREKYYESKGIGCYMFRIDDDTVIDATMNGNAARFINHSCDPNCYSRVVDILGKKHIIIFALRRILRGEELTYDYKFPIEDDKIPCTCGTRRCRKYLN